MDISVVYFTHPLALTMADLDKYSKMAEMDVDDDDEDMSDTDDPDLLVIIIDIFRQSAPKTTSPKPQYSKNGFRLVKMGSG